MKHVIFFSLIATFVALAPFTVNQAQALSCLSIDMYLADVVGKDSIVIFTATSKDRIDETEYTAEVLSVDSVKQGYVEKETFAYHEKSPDWGYLCNNGPKEKGSKGLYVAERTDSGTYQVYQRLELSDPLIKGLDADLKDAEVTGEAVELTKEDRMNQIMTTITDLLKQIGVLLKEYAYWKG